MREGHRPATEPLRRARALVVLVVLATFALTACGGGASTEESAAAAPGDSASASAPDEGPTDDAAEDDAGADGAGAELSPVRIGVNRNIPFLAVWVAEERGLFDEQGLDVELVELGGGAEMRAAILANSTDFTIQSPEGSALLYQEGVELVNLVATQGRLTWSIVMRNALRDEVEPGDAEALRGRTIGVTGRGAGSDMLLQAYLRENDLEPDQDVRIVAVGNFEGAVAALNDGQIDGIMTLEPATTNVVTEAGAGYPFLFYGDGEVFPGADEAPMGSVATLRTTLDEHPDVAEKVVRAVVDALNIMVAEPDWFAEFAAEVAQVDPELYVPVVKEQVIPYLRAEITPEGWEALNTALVDGGVLEEPAPYETVTATQFEDIWAEFEGTP